MRNPLSLSLLLIHGLHPGMKKSSIIITCMTLLSMDKIFPSMDDFDGCKFYLFLSENCKTRLIPRAIFSKNLLLKSKT